MPPATDRGPPPPPLRRAAAGAASHPAADGMPTSPPRPAHRAQAHRALLPPAAASRRRRPGLRAVAVVRPRAPGGHRCRAQSRRASARLHTAAAVREGPRRCRRGHALPRTAWPSRVRPPQVPLDRRHCRRPRVRLHARPRGAGPRVSPVRCVNTGASAFGPQPSSRTSSRALMPRRSTHGCDRAVPAGGGPRAGWRHPLDTISYHACGSASALGPGEGPSLGQ